LSLSFIPNVLVTLLSSSSDMFFSFYHINHHVLVNHTLNINLTLRPSRRPLQIGRGSRLERAEPSHNIVIRHELVFVIVDRGHLVEINLVTEQATDTTKALDELSTLLRLVGDELKVGTEFLVVFGEPFEEGLGFLGLFHFEAGGFVHELFLVLFLLLVGEDDGFLCGIYEFCAGLRVEGVRTTSSVSEDVTRDI
jgi:hypothetical protein